jgi:hypothetical protein
MTSIFRKWKTSSISWKMEDNPIILPMEDDLIFLKNGRPTLENYLANGREPQYLFKWKTTSISFGI